ncbi:hypothetical protein [Mesobacillus harenae]|uniref:hypothetical protein n=1 Tax=Mesobacillus harenae TaxID=2213203 RepID=UPI0015805B95|nr:hypothetical protein [Mesobacillus harenae]
MFCNQCEQTPSGECKDIGVCGKAETIASLQDTIIFALKGIAAYRSHASQMGYTDSFVDATTHEALYMTLTNSNFTVEEHIEMAVKVGQSAVRIIEVLDEAHTSLLGIQQPIRVTRNDHETVLGLAPKVIDAVKEGKIKRFFVISGCDAPGNGEGYYRELAASLPPETIILTTSSGKFRYNDVEYGVVPGTNIPRYIELGQCNNSGSTVKIAKALAEAFECEINEMPISIVLSWFEQKAVAILLGLFSLGIQDIRIGPKPPEFISGGVLAVLQEAFNLKLIGTPQEGTDPMLELVKK